MNFNSQNRQGLILENSKSMSLRAADSQHAARIPHLQSQSDNRLPFLATKTDIVEILLEKKFP